MNSLLRILMTCDRVGGIWTYATDLAQGLREHGMEISLATFGPEPDKSQRDHLHAEGIRLEAAPLKLEWMADWHDFEASIAWLQELVFETRPHLLHFNGFSFSAANWKVPTLVVGHSCVLSWWKAVKGKTAPAKYDEYRWRVACGLKAATEVVAPSTAMLEALKENYDWYGNGRVIPNGRPAPKVCQAVRQPGIISIGRLWDEAKGFRLLEEIAPQLIWPIYVIGDDRGPEVSAGQFDSLRRLGILDQAAVNKMLSRSMVYAAPVLYEPFGLAILEAAFAGCALVLSDLPSLREIWGESAVLLEARDKRAWRDALNWLAVDEAARINLSEKARSRAQVFRVELMYRRYADLYRQLHCESEWKSGL
jgi:glycogen(starch) synthase